MKDRWADGQMAGLQEERGAEREEGAVRGSGGKGVEGGRRGGGDNINYLAKNINEN